MLLGGDILDTQPLPVELAERWVNPIPQSGEFITRFINVASATPVNHRQLPQAEPLSYRYDLRHVFNDEMTEFDLTRILRVQKGRWPLLPKRDWILRAS